MHWKIKPLLVMTPRLLMKVKKVLDQAHKDNLVSTHVYIHRWSDVEHPLNVLSRLGRHHLRPHRVAEAQRGLVVRGLGERDQRVLALEADLRQAQLIFDGLIIWNNISMKVIVFLSVRGGNFRWGFWSTRSNKTEKTLFKEQFPAIFTLTEIMLSLF